jgi:flagellar biogenesis protein FliO
MNKLFLILFFGLLNAEEVIYKSPFQDNSVMIVQYMVKSFLIVLFLILFMAYWYKKILPNLKITSQHSNIKVCDRVQLDPTTVVYLLEIGNQYQTVISSSKNIMVTGNYKKNELKLQKAETPKKEPDFKEYLTKISKEFNNRYVKKKS